MERLEYETFDSLVKIKQKIPHGQKLKPLF